MLLSRVASLPSAARAEEIPRPPSPLSPLGPIAPGPAGVSIGIRDTHSLHARGIPRGLKCARIDNIRRQEAMFLYIYFAIHNLRFYNYAICVEERLPASIECCLQRTRPRYKL